MQITINVETEDVKVVKEEKVVGFISEFLISARKL